MVQGFDPAAATQAYLAVLTPAEHAKAVAYTQGGHWLLLWTMVVGVATAWIVLRSGVLVKVREGIEAKRPRFWLALFAIVALYAVFEALLGLPWAAYSDWWRETSYGLTSQSFVGWLTERGTSLIVGTVLNVVMFGFIYLVIRKAPKIWWALGGGVITILYMALVLGGPVLIQPLFNSYKPAPPGAMRDEIVAMANKVGVPHDRIVIYNGSKQSNRYSANVSGLGPTARIAMSDVMFKKDADLAEVRGVVGHEMGHYVHKHLFTNALAYGLVALACFFLVDRLFPLFSRLLGARGVSGIADPAGLPVIAAIVTVLTLVGTPVISGIIRVTEADADRFSLESFDEPDGLSKALAKTIEYRAATPSALEEFLFYNHESVSHRIRRAMDWKAAHPKAEVPPPPAPSVS